MTVKAKTSFQFLWQEPDIPQEFRCGVSLHSHTMYSEESLDMAPKYTHKLPYVGAAVRRQETAGGFQFAHAFWTPPLAPRQAYRLEEKQIQRRLKLPAVVSLTDHDDIRAGSQLHVLDRFKKAPISTEWTVPFDETFFHLGVHNLPVEQAPEITAQLAWYTASPENARLGSVLAMLNELPDVLIVLNHPLWDEKPIGTTNHARILRRLLAEHGQQLHALELNGLRSWAENKAVIEIGREMGIPVVAGGDRHGREPNAILNLSRAKDMAGFVQEVRKERFSHVVFMPQYREPLKLRTLQTMIDVVREYPENFAGRRVWSDRMYYRNPQTGAVTPLSQVWRDGGPAVVTQFVTAMRLLDWRPLRSALRLALADRSVVWSKQEAAV